MSNAYEVNSMSKQHIYISVEDTGRGFERFIEAWHKAEGGCQFNCVTAIHTGTRSPNMMTN